MTFVIIFVLLLIFLPVISKTLGRLILGSSEEVDSFKRSKINFQKENTSVQNDFFDKKQGADN